MEASAWRFAFQSISGGKWRVFGSDVNGLKLLAVHIGA